MIQFPEQNARSDRPGPQGVPPDRDETAPLRDSEGKLRRELQRVDELLAREARQSRRRMPKDILNRIVTASRGYLTTEAAPASLPFQHAARARNRTSDRTSVWGQLAMAASIGLTFLVAGWFGHSSWTGPAEDVAMHESAGDRSSSPAVAEARPETVTAVRSTGSLAEALGTGSEWLFIGFDDDEVGVLLETKDLSLDDVTTELAALDWYSNL